MNSQRSSSDYCKSTRNKKQYDQLLLTNDLDQDMTFIIRIIKSIKRIILFVPKNIGQLYT